MDKYWVIANWKLNNTRTSTEEWLKQFISEYRPHPKVAVALAPSFCEIPLVASALAEGGLSGTVQLFAQDVSAFEGGKHTGDVSATQLREYGAHGAIIGHSERRHDHHEDDTIVMAKAKCLLDRSMMPLVAVSTISEVSALKTNAELMSAIHLAFEPLAAIGSGNPEDPNVVASFVADVQKVRGSSDAILYGGSVAANNVVQYAGINGIGGFLVGTASNQADTFLALLKELHAI